MRGQTLPWFVVNIIGIITFVILLIAILSLEKNFTMTAKDLDEQTFRMLAIRELVTSPNCWAYSKVEYKFNGNGYTYQIYTVPGLIDYHKITNFYNFNCLRFDYYFNDQITYGYIVSLEDLKEKKQVLFAASYNYKETYQIKDLGEHSNGMTKTMPVLIYYNENEVHPGILTITFYSEVGKNQRTVCEAKR